MNIVFREGRVILCFVAIALMMFAVAGCSDNGDERASQDTASAKNNAANSSSSPAAQFPGSGTAGAGDPLVPGVGPETADECGTGTPGDGDNEVLDFSVDCFFSEEDLELPAAAIEQIVEIIDDITYIHLRLTLDPRFVDNTYGETAIGWEDSKKGEHKFKDLVGSDHAEMKMYDANGELVLHFKIDYISEDDSGLSPSGYGCLGVTDGDGKVIEGEESWILGTATSLDRNLNGCGLLEYTENSPLTDEFYTPNPDASAWDYRMVYEVWADATAFGDAGFGEAIIEHVHASPSKQEDNTIEVTPGPCPPCDPNVEECDPWTPGCDPNVEECDDYEEPCDPNVEACDECDPKTEECGPVV